MMADTEAGPQPVGTLWLLDLQHSINNIVSPRIAANVERAGSEAATLLAAAMGLDEPAPVHERFASGRRCYLAWVDGALASYGWVSFKEEWISELGLYIRLASGDAYLWDCATLPAYRGQGLYPALLAHIAAELRAEGLRRVWIGADTDSLPSQKGIIRAGFQPIADFFPAPATSAQRFQVRGRAG